MDSAKDEMLSIAEAQALLRVPSDLMRALLVSGLLGYVKDGRVSRVGVNHFVTYGTQWRNDLRSPGEQFYRSLPAIEGKDQPVGTRMQVQICPGSGGLVKSGHDSGWLAQFYIRPNPFFFVDPSVSAPIGPRGLKLQARREVAGTAKATYLYPDPEGELAMIMVLGGPGSGPAQDAYSVAYDIVGPLLDELAFQYDLSLEIAHAFLVGVPSGVITTAFPKPPSAQTISEEATLFPRCPMPLLEEATALYREGISSANPFHQFLALWKAHENATQVRGEWRQRVTGAWNDSRKDILVEEEVIPKVFAFADFGGLKFGAARERLRDSHRNAVAHGTRSRGRPKTGANASDYLSVAVHVPMIRHMARVTLLNTRATLVSAVVTQTSSTDRS